jgi:hypothetical protein
MPVNFLSDSNAKVKGAGLLGIIQEFFRCWIPFQGMFRVHEITADLEHPALRETTAISISRVGVIESVFASFSHFPSLTEGLFRRARSSTARYPHGGRTSLSVVLRRSVPANAN